MRKYLHLILFFILIIHGNYSYSKNNTSEFTCSTPIIRYVKADATPGGNGMSWATAYNTLQDALTGDLTCVQVWIAGGTYYPTQMIDITDERSRSIIVADNVEIYGGFAGTETAISQRNIQLNETIISADFDETPTDDTDNSYHALYILNATGNTTIIDGITIQDGRGKTTSTPFHQGGGIYIKNSVVDLRNMTVKNCKAQYGGGIYTINSIVSIENSTINNNYANVAGGGIYNDENGILTYMNIIIHNNQSDYYGGGLYNDNCSIVMTNALVYENTTNFVGGGIRNQKTTMTINNGTIVKNVSTNNFGGGIGNNETTNLYLNNCIVYFNEAAGDALRSIYNKPPSNTYVKNSSIDGGLPNINVGVNYGGNLHEDPVFVDIDNDNYRLEECSPLLNVGLNSENTLVKDLAGNPRIFNSGIIDMGAYEYQGEPSTIETPTGDTVQHVCNIITLDEIVVSSQDGTEIVWYATETSTDILDGTTQIVSGNTYYAEAKSTTNVCQSGGRLGIQVIVSDTQVPVIENCLGIQILNPEANCQAVMPDYSDILSIVDNCNYTVTQTPAAGTMVENIVNVNIVVTDDAGNTATCDFIAVVQDITAPELVCGDDIIVVSDPDLCGTIVNYDLPEVIDNCDSDLIPSLTNGIVSGAFFPVGETINTFQIEDSIGNVVTCTQKVIVQESGALALNCPDNIVVNNDPGECGAVVTFDLPEVTNNCASVLVEQTGGLVSGQVFPVGITENTYKIENDLGEVITCSFTIEVIDSEDPVIVCPTDITANADSGGCTTNVTYNLPEITDNCKTYTITQTNGFASGEAFPVGETTNTFSIVSDDGTESFTCSFKVTVDAVDPIVITCPSDIVITNDFNQCGAVVTYDSPTTTGNCLGLVATQTSGLASGELFPIGETVNTFVYEDGDGVITECSFKVTVEDNQSLVLSCSGDITVDNDPGECGAVVDYPMPVATDNCDPVSFIMTEGLATGSFFPIGTTAITYEIMSTDGTLYTCSFDIIVNDVEEPQVVCTTDVTVNSSTEVCGAHVVYDIPQMVDNCASSANFTLIEGVESGGFFEIGTTEVRYQYIKDDGEVLICGFNVTVVDTNDLVIEGYISDHELTLNHNCTLSLPNYLVLDMLNPTGTCSEVSMSQDPAPGSQITEDTQVTIKAEDELGNTDTFTFTVLIKDETMPVIEEGCPENQVILLDYGSQYTMEDFMGDIVVSDNCTFEVTQDPEVGELLPFGMHIVKIKVEDISGNIEICEFELQLDEDISVGEEELVNFNIYPNPTRDYLYISSSRIVDTVEIYSLLGQKVMTVSETNINQVDVSELEIGTYLIVCKSDEFSLQKKFIKR
ncbi:HYR domain-containing protein [Aureivirga marina]|uniref:HYR domain-containing protein n=1 Tax=Aureivirga marina TaxID=1182451 RepID=UPI0018CA94DE|nr:HYR domain-containing protein [Aureivirga marina]